jgi:hypothetical protein
MSKVLTLQIRDDVYEPLLKKANQIGQTPEQIAIEWIENQIKTLTDDPLLQLAGIFESKITNVSDRHDEYIGQSLRNDDE